MLTCIASIEQAIPVTNRLLREIQMPAEAGWDRLQNAIKTNLSDLTSCPVVWQLLCAKAIL